MKTQVVNFAGNASKIVWTGCGTGLLPIGGGARGDANTSLQSSNPDGTGWSVRVLNTSGTARNITFYAVCARA